MYTVELETANGDNIVQDFKTLRGACEWIMNQRGVFEVLISRDAQDPADELETELEHLGAVGNNE